MYTDKEIINVLMLYVSMKYMYLFLGFSDSRNIQFKIIINCFLFESSRVVLGVEFASVCIWYYVFVGILRGM